MLNQTPADHPDLAQTVAPKPRRLRSGPWSKQQLAMFAYMVGSGFPGTQIAEIMGCETNSVANACKRYGLQLARRRNRDEVVPVVISKETAAVLEDAALLRGISRKVLIERLLAALGDDEEQTLIDNVLDDQN